MTHREGRRRSVDARPDLTDALADARDVVEANTQHTSDTTDLLQESASTLSGVLEHFVV